MSAILSAVAHMPPLSGMAAAVPSHPDAPCTLTDWAGHSEFAAARRAAADRCAACPVLGPCDAAAVDRGERWGVWGGVDRESLYRAEHRDHHGGKGPRPAAVCGTESGYKAHRRAHAAACGPCKQAHNLAQSRWREARTVAS